MDLDPNIALGQRRLALLDARIASGVVPPWATADEAAWLTQLVPKEAAIGFAPSGVDSALLASLSSAGLPIAPGGVLRYADDLAVDSACVVPRVEGARLLVPPAAVLAELTSLRLKPMRQWVAARLGVRLKIGGGVHLRLWPSRAVLISTAAIPLGGFLSGPQAGTRASIYLGAGATQYVPL